MDRLSSEWELSKENIQPIQQGRKVDALRTALAVHPDDKFLEKRRLFEQELRAYTGDDPLSVWCEYIKWVEQNYPKGGKDGNIFKLVQQCLSILQNEKKYYNDERFINIWIKLAKMSAKPTDIFNNMYSRKIGLESSTFYVEWAWHMENTNNMKRADEILLEGINRKAQPLDVLKSAYEQFQVRLCNSFALQPDKKPHMLESESEQRSAFTLLKPQKKNKAPVARVGLVTIPAGQENMKVTQHVTQPPLKESNSSNIPFKIYHANSIVSSLPVQADITSNPVLGTEGSKENEKKPGKWTKARVHQQAVSSVKSTPDFAFHHDKTPEQGSVKKPSETPHVLTARKGIPSPPLALFEPPDPNKRPMYNKIKVYGGAEEFSFEEMRAMAWFRKRKELEKEKRHEKQMEELHEKIRHLEEKLNYWENKAPGATMQVLSRQQCEEHHFATPSVGRTSVPVPSAAYSDNVRISKTAGYKASASNPLSFSVPSSNRRIPVDKGHENAMQGHCKISGNAENLHVPAPGPSEPLKSEAENHSPPASDTMISKIFQELYNGTLSHSLKEATDPSLAVLLGKNHEVRSACEEPGKLKDLSERKTSSYKSDDPHIVECGGELLASKGDDETTKPVGPEDSEEGATPIPFPIYQDETHTRNLNVRNIAPILLQDGIEGPETEEMDKKENIPPPDHNQVLAEKRELAGVLQPSKNIYYVPLEDQLKEKGDDDDEDDDECLAMPLPDTENFTIIPPLSAEQFAAAARFASTPCARDGTTAARDLALVTEAPTECMPPPPPPLAAESSNLFSNLRRAVLASDHAKAQSILQAILETSDRRGNCKVLCENLRACLEGCNSPFVQDMIDQALHILEANASRKDTSQANQQSTYRTFQLSTIMESSREVSSKSSSSSCSSIGSNRNKSVTAFLSKNTWSVTKTSLAETTSNNSAKSFTSVSVTAASENPVTTTANCVHSANEVSQNFLQYIPPENEFCTEIDPFDQRFTSELIRSLEVPVSDRKNFYKNKSFTGNIKIGMEFSAGNVRCIIEKLHAEGAYAKVYSAYADNDQMIDMNQSMISTQRLALKVCKHANEWEFYICSELRDRLLEKQSTVDVTDSVIDIKSAVAGNNNLVLVSDLHGLGTLLDIVNAYKKNSTPFPETLALYFTLEMLQIMSAIHECGILHCDVKPDNFVLNNISVSDDIVNMLLKKTKCLRLIDFGRSIDLKLLRPGITFKQVVKTDSFQCIEMKEGRPWVFQPDWYGILGCIHVMLFSDYMTVQKNKCGAWEPTKRFRRYWQVDVWQVIFQELLNIPSCYKAPNLKPVCQTIAERLQKDAHNLKKCLRQTMCIVG